MPCVHAKRSCVGSHQAVNKGTRVLEKNRGGEGCTHKAIFRCAPSMSYVCTTFASPQERVSVMTVIKNPTHLNLKTSKTHTQRGRLPVIVYLDAIVLPHWQGTNLRQPECVSHISRSKQLCYSRSGFRSGLGSFT